MATRSLAILVSVILIAYDGASIAAAEKVEEPTVTIKQGTLKGIVRKSLNDKNIFSFHGIPYAKPPVGPFRFKEAEPAEPWQGVLDASKNRSICAQVRLPDLHFVGEEDCLFANVYTNKLPEGGAKSQQLAPVIVLIHGGIFIHSSGDWQEYDPAILLDGGDPLVLVTFNYRLGVVGFLSTEDEVCPGNNGLKDQVLLLEWVRDNIAAFGGNPGQVTLMGDNAGAVSAHMHMLSPRSKGLFHAAISQSGTALTHWALSRDPLGRAQYLAELLDCGGNKTSSAKIVECLRDVDINKLVRKSQIVLTWRTDWIVPFLPSAEDKTWSPKAFLPGHPRDLLQKGKFTNAVPWLVSVTSHDGLPHSLQLLLFSGIMADMNDDFEKYFPYYFELEGPMDRAKKAAKKVRSFYFKGNPMGMGTQTELANLHTDYYYFVPLVKSAAMHVMNDSPEVFIYHFSFQYRRSRLATGVPQGDDTQFLLPKAEHGRGFPEKGSMEMKIARRLATIVRNFATFKKPIPEGDNSMGVPWLPIDSKNMNYIDLNKKLTRNTTFYKERIDFWNEIEDLLEGEYSTTTAKPKEEL